MAPFAILNAVSAKRRYLYETGQDAPATVLSGTHQPLSSSRNDFRREVSRLLLPDSLSSSPLVPHSTHKILFWQMIRKNRPAFLNRPLAVDGNPQHQADGCPHTD